MEHRAQTQKATTLVVGLGNTGLSVARFLARRGEAIAVADSREHPPAAEALRAELPEVACHFGPFEAARFSGYVRLVVSPGLSLREPAIEAARQQGAEVIGDIELFARHADAPVVAVTGSNGKSTVTALLGEMARAAGCDVRVGGNIGTPALDLLQETAPDLYVLELSSFQLEATDSLRAQAAVVLNVSPDHLDRHADLEEYAAIKRRIYRGDGVMVLNADDPQVAAMAEAGRRAVCFSVNGAAGVDYGLVEVGGANWLAHHGEPLLPASDMRLAGGHNLANALAALALGEAMGLPWPAMLAALKSFPGLPHRCQWVAERDGVAWYNDSKGTNVGATLAALTGLPGQKVVLIAGGEGKGQDFTPLREALARRGRALVLIGRDAPLIAEAVGETVPVVDAADMPAAVERAASLAEAGDSVLLSPACASFDMFDNYIARGEAFVAAVRGRQA